MRIHVLLVDDEVDMEFVFRMHFKKWIRREIMKLSFSSNGEEALSILKIEEGRDIILILSDINMPGLNGLDLLKTVKKLYPNIDVFMITAYDTEDYRERAIGLGADSYFTKPVDFSLLKERIILGHPDLGNVA